MQREYEVFERFRDGSTLWRASVTGRFEAHRKAQEFAEHSESEFFILNLQDGAPLPKLVRSNAQLPVKRVAVG